MPVKLAHRLYTKPLSNIPRYTNQSNDGSQLEDVWR
jgi:hypothetical protein